MPETFIELFGFQHRIIIVYKSRSKHSVCASPINFVWLAYVCDVNLNVHCTTRYIYTTKIRCRNIEAT